MTHLLQRLVGDHHHSPLPLEGGGLLHWLHTYRDGRRQAQAGWRLPGPRQPWAACTWRCCGTWLLTYERTALTHSAFGIPPSAGILQCLSREGTGGASAGGVAGGGPGGWDAYLNTTACHTQRGQDAARLGLHLQPPAGATLHACYMQSELLKVCPGWGGGCLCQAGWRTDACPGEDEAMPATCETFLAPGSAWLDNLSSLKIA